MSASTDSAVVIDGSSGILSAVEIGATFLTGVEVDGVSAFLDAGEDGLAARVSRSSTVPFVPAAVVTRRSNGSFYTVIEAHHGTDVLPQTLAGVDPGWLLAQCRTHRPPFGWALVRAECDIHDYGVGMIVLRWQPVLQQRCDPEDLEELVDFLSEATRAVTTPLAGLIASAFRAALRNDPARLDLTHGLDVDHVAVLPPVGEVLWQWHLLMVSCAATDHRDLAQAVAAIVCPNTFHVMEHRDYTFAPGVHASVVCVTAGREKSADFLSRAPRTQDAWWTLYWRLDRVLLALQLRLEASLATGEPKELKTRAAVLLNVTSRVNLLRSRLDSLLVSSGARDLAAWNALGSAWDLPYRMEVVDKKMVLLDGAYSSAVRQISSGLTARVNFMIYLFTAFSLVASVVAVADFTQGSFEPGAPARLVIVVGSVAGAVLAVLLSIRTTRRIRKRFSESRR